jgi:hypothetical protein
MPSAASSQKELRFALLSLFPSAGLKEVSEAGRGLVANISRDDTASSDGDGSNIWGTNEKTKPLFYYVLLVYTVTIPKKIHK